MTMPSFSSTGCSSELSRLMIGRSWRNRPTLWPNWSPKHSISLSKPKSCALGQTLSTLAGVEQDVLAVADRDALVGQGRDHRRLGDIHADRHVRHTLGTEDCGDLSGGGPEQAGVRGHRAA